MDEKGVPKNFTEANYQSIPEAPGLYAFYLKILGLPQVGLLEPIFVNNEEQELVKANIANRLNKAFKLFRSQEFNGSLIGSQRGKHIAQVLSLKAIEQPPNNIAQEVSSLKPAQQLLFTQYASSFTNFLQPVYVGITVNQTLKERFIQHRQSFEKRDEYYTNFGSRIRSAGFDWDDLIFSCVQFDGTGDAREILRLLEKSLQALAQPALSSQ